MAKFRFRFDSVKRLRQLRLEQAEAALERAIALREARRRDLLAALGLESAARSDAPQGYALLDHYLNRAQRDQQQLRGLINQADGEVERHRELVRDAQRQVKLLDRLETADRARWQHQADLVVMETAADSHLSRFLRERAADAPRQEDPTPP